MWPMTARDVWARPDLFLLAEGSFPAAVAGCPPDAFSATGQLWGNPLYRWDYHKSKDLRMVDQPSESLLLSV